MVLVHLDLGADAARDAQHLKLAIEDLQGLSQRRPEVILVEDLFIFHGDSEVRHDHVGEREEVVMWLRSSVAPLGSSGINSMTSLAVMWQAH